MAHGDVAASIGIPTVSSGEDIRLGSDEMNRILDVIAGHFISGTHPASAISTGTLDAARIPSLPGSQIGSGVLDAARIPTLDAAKVGTGTLDAARIPALDGSKITSGNVDVSDAGGIIRGAQLITPGILTAVGVRTTGLSGFQSVVTNSSGAIGVATSSSRFKQDILVAVMRTGLLTPGIVKTYRYRADVKAMGDEAPIYRGLIAEQLHKLGLTEYVVYDDAGRPYSVRYELVVLDIIQIVQDHESRLLALEAKGEN